MLKVNKKNWKKKELEILKDNIYATILIIFIIIALLWYLIYVFDFNNSLLYNEFWNNYYWNKKQKILSLLDSKYDSRKFVPDNLLVYDKYLFYNSLFDFNNNHNNKIRYCLLSFHENKSLFLEYDYRIIIDHIDTHYYISSQGERRKYWSNLCITYPWWNYKISVYCQLFERA